MATERRRCQPTVRAHLTSRASSSTETRRGRLRVTLPGERKLQTTVRLDVGEHALGVHAFVAAHPTRTTRRVYRWLLERNLRMYAVAFAVDRLGDIYLDGRLPLTAVTSDELDRMLGAVLAYADESFNTILELGFASSIRKEWEWRSCAASRPPTSRRSAAGWRAAPSDPVSWRPGRPRGRGRRVVPAREDPAADRRGAVRAGDDHASRKNTWTSGLSATSPHTRPATRNPL